MPDGVTDLFRFYADQYGMIFYTVYDPVNFIIKGHMVFHNIRRTYCIMCAGLTENEIVNHFHTIIFDVLAGGEKNVLDQ